MQNKRTNWIMREKLMWEATVNCARISGGQCNHMVRHLRCVFINYN